MRLNGWQRCRGPGQRVPPCNLRLRGRSAAAGWAGATAREPLLGGLQGAWNGERHGRWARQGRERRRPDKRPGRQASRRGWAVSRHQGSTPCLRDGALRIMATGRSTRLIGLVFIRDGSRRIRRWFIVVGPLQLFPFDVHDAIGWLSIVRLPCSSFVGCWVVNADPTPVLQS